MFWVSMPSGSCILLQKLVENLSVLFALTASGLCLAAFRLRRGLPGRWLGVWLLLCAIGCFFYAGEEASWGQHWTGYGSPEFFAEHNSQGELNFHNLGKLSTQRVPKTLLSVGVVVTGFMLPLRRRRIGRVWPPTHALHWWLPDASCVPVASISSRPEASRFRTRNQVSYINLPLMPCTCDPLNTIPLL